MHFLIVDTKPNGSHMIDKADSTFSLTYSKVLNDYNIDESFIERIKSEKCIHIENAVDSYDEPVSRTFILVQA